MNQKVQAVNDILESFLGLPRQKRERTDPLDMLIGTLLSQNTNDTNSHRAYRELRRRFPTWKKVAEAPASSIASAIKVGGLKNQKSRRIKALLKNIHKRFDSYSLRRIKHLPADEVMHLLLSFDGIGTKTAACVLLFSLRKEVFPVDTHIHRILNRLGILKTTTPDQTFEAMRGRVPAGKSYSLHTNLIRFGRTVCTSQRPSCRRCPLFDVCEFPEKERFAAEAPSVSKRKNPRFMLLDHI